MLTERTVSVAHAGISAPFRSSGQPNGAAVELFERARGAIDARLESLVPPEATEPRGLHRAMRFSLLAPGKRLRPVLTLATACAFGGGEQAALDPACAVEMTHTASLILDDLPCMDDATLRRGRPANHRLHGEATATLAAVALLNRAYGVLAESAGLSPGVRGELVALLSRAIGSNGAVAGQCRDLDGNDGCDVETLSEVEGLKTSALFTAAVESGALVAGLADEELEPIRRLAWDLGLAFQLRDDWIDAVGERERVGKDVRQDAGKTTLVALLGAERSKTLFEDLLDSATAALDPLGPKGRGLGQVCRELMTRAS